MRAAILQPNYLPWRGYFDLIHDVDLFIFLDDVQYTTRDWRNRNLIRTDKGTEWITVPVGSSRNRLIYEVQMTGNQWGESHWKTIQQHYSKAPYFSKFQEFFGSFYMKMEWGTLAEMNQFLTQEISHRFLGLKTRFLSSSELGIASSKGDKILGILEKVGATSYISGPSAKDYLCEKDFLNRNIELIWKEYPDYPEYQQRYTPFMGKVSIIDLLFNVGEASPQFIWDLEKNPQEIKA